MDDLSPDVRVGALSPGNWLYSVSYNGFLRTAPPPPPPPPNSSTSAFSMTSLIVVKFLSSLLMYLCCIVGISKTSLLDATQ